jgi:hypothetical protein
VLVIGNSSRLYRLVKARSFFFFGVLSSCEPNSHGGIGEVSKTNVFLWREFVGEASNSNRQRVSLEAVHSCRKRHQGGLGVVRSAQLLFSFTGRLIDPGQL